MTGPEQPSLLICTGQFRNIAGSEVVVAELAEVAAAGGCLVDLFAVRAGAPMLDGVRPHIRTLFHADDPPNPLGYDHVWVQHQTAALLRWEWRDGLRSRTQFLFAHLSGVTPLELPGPVFETLLADTVVVNAPETAWRLERFGVLSDDVHCFFNAAPARFLRQAPVARPAVPGRVLIVSNHPPSEALDAAAILRGEGIQVDVVGLGNTVRRVDEALLHGCDAVMTIGKTVQYCLLSRVPVYCYDLFGGPGYISDPAVHERAEWYNFSGRGFADPSTPDGASRRSAAVLAREIAQGYGAAAAYADGIEPARLRRYVLEEQLAALLRRPAVTNADRFAALLGRWPDVQRTRAAATAARAQDAPGITAGADPDGKGGFAPGRPLVFLFGVQGGGHHHLLKRLAEVDEGGVEIAGPNRSPLFDGPGLKEPALLNQALELDTGPVVVDAVLDTYRALRFITAFPDAESHVVIAPPDLATHTLASWFREDEIRAHIEPNLHRMADENGAFLQHAVPDRRRAFASQFATLLGQASGIADILALHWLFSAAQHRLQALARFRNVHVVIFDGTGFRSPTAGALGSFLRWPDAAVPKAAIEEARWVLWPDVHPAVAEACGAEWRALGGAPAHRPAGPDNHPQAADAEMDAWTEPPGSA